MMLLTILLLAFLASILLIYPLRAQKKLGFILMPVIVLGLISGYLLWGGFPVLQEYARQKKAELVARQMLQSVKSPQELIEKLKAKLDNSPHSAKGWYLLGRLYSSQNELSKAVTAFAKAHELQANEEQFTINYVHSLWLENHQQFTPKSLAILEKVLAANPNQPDALAMMAMNSFINEDYDKTIVYWEKLLKIVPADSEEGKAIRKAIAKASNKRKHAGPV